jgi:hypothetical protein
MTASSRVTLSGFHETWRVDGVTHTRTVGDYCVDYQWPWWAVGPQNPDPPSAQPLHAARSLPRRSRTGEGLGTLTK